MTTEAEYQTELDGIDKYGDEFEDLRVRYQAVKPKSRPASSASSEVGTTASNVSIGQKKKTFKLPKIELKKFGGEVTEWLGFWAQFEKIHTDDDLHPSDKYQYLVQSTVVDSRARELVESYPQTGDNYPKVIEALQERFGKPKSLKRVYVRELLNLVISNNVSKVTVSQIYDRLESHLRALHTLGITMEMMDVLLFPLVESCLPSDFLIAWQRSSNYGRDGTKENPPKTEFEYLLHFIKTEVESEQQRLLAQTTFGLSLKENKGKKTTTFKKEMTEVPTAAGLFSSQGSTCIFCEKNHPSQECGKAQTMPISTKENFIKKKNVCFSCLQKGHGAKKCSSFVKCPICTKKHHALMCPDLPINRKDKKQQESQGQGDAVATHLNCTNSVLLKTLLVRVNGNGSQRVVRLILDDGSQRSYLTEATARKLQLKPVGREHIKKSLFGGRTTEVRAHKRYEVELESLDAGRREIIILIDEPTLCGRIPKVPNGPWLRELQQKNIHLSDLNSDSDIEILIGSDYWGKIVTGKMEKLSCGLVAVDTVFGWTLSGPIPSEGSLAMTLISVLLTEHISVSDLWNLETLGIRDPIESLTKTEREKLVQEHFQQRVTRGDDGRYSVSLPWIDGRPQISSNRSVAEKRLLGTTTKLKTLGKFSAYDDVFCSWKKEGIVERVEEKEEELVHYLPHRAVLKPGSLTTPIRPVFDASCKVGRHPSLNECLEKGPNFLELIPAILLRFRVKRIGITADIRKAFQMIEVCEADRRFLRFLWWSDCACQQMEILQHTRVVFGVNSSPFLLHSVLEHHLRQVQGEDLLVAEKLLRSLYVDNCVTSVDYEKERMNFKDVATRILGEGKMELRQWEFTGDASRIGHFSHGGCGLEACSDSSYSKTTSSVLGLQWDKGKDHLTVDFNVDMPEVVLTKRQVLSLVSKIFDPLGFVSPVTIQPKLLLQELWASKFGWDEEIPEEKANSFLKWCQEVAHLKDIHIPRHLGPMDPEEKEIHVFGDASRLAYAAVVFLRSVKEGVVTVQLLQSKARVSPLKRGSIPRLELMAALIGVRLATTITEALDYAEVPIHFWSDSTTVLAWIRGNDDWGTFVGNRVREILRHSKASNWRFVPGVLNPADLPSRGCSPLQLLESRWWEGPDWLKKPNGSGQTVKKRWTRLKLE